MIIHFFNKKSFDIFIKPYFITYKINSYLKKLLQ